ncbi:MAG: prepilin-type N-terminal cleavage/methylation domain-containing protein [Lentimonas sp.]|jgi:prepilin-type N-terminal cleavage/methylation domain-containing protein
MKIQNKLNKNAFSLIELSVVILIIGILILGVTKGSSLLAKTSLSSARSLTTSSPVPVIEDLVAWYETSLESSIDKSIAIDGTTIDLVNGSSWNDNAPRKKRNATDVAGNPVYTELGINNLPSITFDGTGDSISFNASDLNERFFTIFVVERRGDDSATNHFLGLGAGAGFGYLTETTLTGPSIVDDLGEIKIFSNLTPRIITFLSGPISTSNTKGIFINGGSSTGEGSELVDSQVASTPIATTNAGTIGSDAGAANLYVGDISEIIIYNRSLNVNERNDVQEYLSKKYNINVEESI